MDLSVASRIHSNKITADRLVCMLVLVLVLVTTEITKIHGIHLCNDGMAYIKTHVELMPIRCTD